MRENEKIIPLKIVDIEGANCLSNDFAARYEIAVVRSGEVNQSMSSTVFNDDPPESLASKTDTSLLSPPATRAHKCHFVTGENSQVRAERNVNL